MLSIFMSSSVAVECVFRILFILIFNIFVGVATIMSTGT